jgi:hypothetical protein
LWMYIKQIYGDSVCCVFLTTYCSILYPNGVLFPNITPMLTLITNP